MYKTKLNVTIIALFIHAIFLICGATGNAQTIFFDDFNENSLDDSKWNIKLKGGTYTLANGALNLYSSEYWYRGDGFPAIFTKTNPFPINQDWTLTTMMQYISGPNLFGDGMAVYNESLNQRIAYVYQSLNKGEFNMWDTNLNKEITIWNGDTLNDKHTFTVQRNGSYYEGYVDGVFAGSVFNESNPGRLVLGNDDVGPLYGNWNPVSIGYVEISVNDPEIIPSTFITPASVPEPGSFILTLAGITVLIFKLTLSLRTHHSRYVA